MCTVSISGPKFLGNHNLTSHRCAKAGFVCKGYAVPKAWIFEPRSSQNHESSPQDYHENDEALSSRSTPTTSTSHAQQYPPVLSKALTLGNSDPFHAYAVQIGPTDNFYLKYYHLTVIPQIYTIVNRRWTSSLASNERLACVNSLRDEAGAYSLLARNAAIYNVQSGSDCKASQTTVLVYQGRAQAALRKKIMSLDGETLHDDTVMYETMWATYLLALTDVLLKAPSAKVHLNALRELFTRYASVKGADLDGPRFLFPFYVDIHYACTTLSRPMFDILKCFPEIEDFDYSKWHVPDISYNCDVHPEVEDKTVRRMIVVKREGQCVHRDFLNHRFDESDLKPVSFALHSRNLWFQAVMLNGALDVLEKLRTRKALDITGYHLNARAFISIAVLHWGRFASVFPVAGKLLYDEAPATLPMLRLLILQQGSYSNASAGTTKRRSYADARLWALFVGTQSEKNRQDVLGLVKVCDDWFLDEFRAQAYVMGVKSWAEAVSIFRQFLYNDHLQPHISTWW